MRLSRVTGVFALTALLAGCAEVPLPPADARAGAATTEAEEALAFERPAYNVRQVEISVPDTLKVSEANAFYPLADIVWRGEPRGDRRAQVRAIFDEAATRAASERVKGLPVAVEIEVRRFHALTEKARYTVGGVHSIEFELTVKDAKTGAMIEEPRVINGDLPAAGGETALEEDAMGLTQKVLITQHLAKVLSTELAPGPVTSPKPRAGAAAQ
jgi:hypothetical protein